MSRTSLKRNVEDICQREILELLREELQPRDREEYPIEQWYRRFYLEPNRGFPPYGEPIADFLEGRRDQFDRITEIGAGIGHTCVQLAARGWKTVAVEPVARQWEMMGRLFDRIEAIAPEVRARIQAHRVGYPRSAEEYLDARTVAAFFGLGGRGSVDPVVERDRLESLRHAGGVILEPEFFLRPRLPAEQDALVNEIEALGFEPHVPVWDNKDGHVSAFPKIRLIFFRRKSDHAPALTPTAQANVAPSIGSVT